MSKLALYGGAPVRKTVLYKGWPGIREYGLEEIENLVKVIKARSPFRYYGPDLQNMVKNFEKSMCERFGVKHAVGVTSCTASLIIALKAAGIGPGDKVIVPACTFVATAGAVVCAGAVPVFCDVDDTMNIDPYKIKDVADKYTKAVITVPLGGFPVQMDKVMEEARKLGLIVIEDVAQSMGASLNGKPMGTWGDIGCFSLQMNKIITTGEGGVVISNNDTLFERAVRYHDQGQYREQEGFLTNSAEHVFIGQNYRMSELTGAVALAQIEKLDIIVGRMKQVKKHIKDAIKDIPGIRFKRVIDEDGDAACSLTLLFDTVEKADIFNKALNAEGIAVSAQYGGRPVYMIPQIFHQKTVDRDNFPFNQFDEPVVYTEDMCPNANYYMPRSCFISLSAEFEDGDVQDIITAIRKVAAEIL